jgi:ATPase subunit of ABC transporter with duplicated ATPase domains
MVIVSHDREFLDQLCTKIVEVERGMVRAALLRVRRPRHHDADTRHA